MARLRVGQRLRARLRGEVRVYGLQAPASVRLNDTGAEIEVEEPGDRPIVEGFAAAEQDMLALDLERRLWSGRLAELLGRQSIGGLPADELDIFIRLLGLRADAERAIRRLEPELRTYLDAVAAGPNAWTDAGRWTGDPGWRQLETRPRLFGAADLLLLEWGRLRAARLVRDVPAAPTGWPQAWTPALQHRLDAVHLALESEWARSSNVLAGALDSSVPPTPDVPVGLFAEEVLPGGDHHRIVDGEGWRRLSVRRPDLPVRGDGRRRPWLRRGPRGPLVSDVLQGSGDETPPVGSAFSFAWEESEGASPPRQSAPSGRGRVRLVPLLDGA